MRVLPLALWHTGDDMALVLDAHRQSLPTHAHPRSMVACAFHSLMAKGYPEVDDLWTWAAFQPEESYAHLPEHSDLVSDLMQEAHLRKPKDESTRFQKRSSGPDAVIMGTRVEPECG